MRQVGLGAVVVVLALMSTALVAGSAKGGHSTAQGYVQPHYFRVHLSGTEQIHELGRRAKFLRGGSGVRHRLSFRAVQRVRMSAPTARCCGEKTMRMSGAL